MSSYDPYDMDTMSPSKTWVNVSTPMARAAMIPVPVTSEVVLSVARVDGGFILLVRSENHPVPPRFFGAANIEEAVTTVLTALVTEKLG